MHTGIFQVTFTGGSSKEEKVSVTLHVLEHQMKKHFLMKNHEQIKLTHHPPHVKNRIKKVNEVSVLNNCYPIKKIKEFRK